MKFKNQENIEYQTKETILDKIRKHSISKYIASVLLLSSFWTTLWLSSCKDNHEKSTQDLIINIIPEDHKVDISWWNKIIDTDWYSLRIWDEKVADWNQNCEIRVENADPENKKPIILWTTFLEKPWKIIVHLIPFDMSDLPEMPEMPESLKKSYNEQSEEYKKRKKKYDKRMKKYEKRIEQHEKTGYIILVTEENSPIIWLENLKNVQFRVWESINLMKYIHLNNVSLDKITITYPEQEPQEIDNECNFIPKYEGQKLDLKVQVIKEWKLYTKVTEINILPQNREPIWPTIENSKLDWIPPISQNEIHDNNTYQYIQDSKAAIGRKMIQAMSHHGTTTLSPKEYKNQENKVVYFIVKEKKHWNNEIIWEWENKGTHLDQLINENVIKKRIKNAEFITIADDGNNSRQSQIVKHAQSHPEETIIVCNSLDDIDTDETTTIHRNSVEIKKFLWLNKVIELNTKWTNEYNNLNRILVWLDALLNTDNTWEGNNFLNWENQHTSSILNIWWSINKILPPDLSLKVDFSHADDWKYKLEKWEYPLIIFDTPWSMVKINWQWIPCNKENWYRLKNTNISWCERCIDGNELKKLGYKPWNSIKWNVIVLDEEGGKFNITIPIVIEIAGL